MKIEHFNTGNIILEKHEKYRDNNTYQIKNCIIVGRNNYYPNCLLYNERLVSPYDEKVMSLNKTSFYDNNEFDTDNIKLNQYSNVIENDVYFFIYNFDNYYHFVYDTIHYLINYLELKKKNKKLRLLVNYPNKNNKFYQFNLELFELLKIDDYITHEPNNFYKSMFVSNSLTHGGKSNEPPNDCVYDFFNSLSKNVLNTIKTFDKIYISRRTWTRENNDNIGTNYTTRRKMVNEDKIVEILKKNGYVEIFAEDYSFVEKIQLFSKAKYIVGAIGGGMCNLLFSGKQIKTMVFVSPDFMNINNRFKYSLDGTDIIYFYDCYHSEKQDITSYTRVKINNVSEFQNKIGEVVEYNPENNMYKVNLSNNDVAGFNNAMKYDNAYFRCDELIKIDNGLNSPYYVDEKKLENILEFF